MGHSFAHCALHLIYFRLYSIADRSKSHRVLCGWLMWIQLYDRPIDRSNESHRSPFNVNLRWSPSRFDQSVVSLFRAPIIESFSSPPPPFFPFYCTLANRICVLGARRVQIEKRLFLFFLVFSIAIGCDSWKVDRHACTRFDRMEEIFRQYWFKEHERWDRRVQCYSNRYFFQQTIEHRISMKQWSIIHYDTYGFIKKKYWEFSDNANTGSGY